MLFPILRQQASALRKAQRFCSPLSVRRKHFSWALHSCLLDYSSSMGSNLSFTDEFGFNDSSFPMTVATASGTDRPSATTGVQPAPSVGVRALL